MTPARPPLLTSLPLLLLLATALFAASSGVARAQSDPYSNASISEALRQMERAYGRRLTFAQRRIITQAATTRRDEMRAADQKFRATAARALGLTVADLDVRERTLREQERQRQREQSRRQQQQQQQQRRRYQASPNDRTTRRRSSSSSTRRYRRQRGSQRGTATTGGRTTRQQR